MGDVLIMYKVMPIDQDVDLEKIAEIFATYVPEHGRVSRYEVKPAFFGLNMLEWGVVLDDKKGGGDELEAKLNETKGVQSVEILEMGLL